MLCTRTLSLSFVRKKIKNIIYIHTVDYIHRTPYARTVPYRSKIKKIINKKECGSLKFVLSATTLVPDVVPFHRARPSRSILQQHPDFSLSSGYSEKVEKGSDEVLEVGLWTLSLFLARWQASPM